MNKKVDHEDLAEKNKDDNSNLPPTGGEPLAEHFRRKKLFLRVRASQDWRMWPIPNGFKYAVIVFAFFACMYVSLKSFRGLRILN